MNPSVPLPSAESARPPAGAGRGTPLFWPGVCGALGLILGGLWIARILPAWLQDPDLSHGLFTPILFGLLVRESRRRGPARFLTPGPALWSMSGLIILAGLGALLAGALYAVSVDWTHSLTLFVLGAAWSAGLLAAWLVAASASVRLMSFNWTAFAAIGLWMLSVPLPPGTYSALTAQLQLWVTGNVLGALHLLGIPAAQNGNLIELAHTTVGVEEACSGVRSLLSCVYAAWFLAAQLMQRPWARLVLLALAAPLAIGMNFLRSLLLTLLANGGIDIGGAWHDLSGFAILGVTAALLGGLALLLERSATTGAPRPAPRPADLSVTRAGWPLLTGGAVAALAIVMFFVVQTRPAESRGRVAPDLWALLPGADASWYVAADENLYRFAAQLQTDHLAQRTYVRPTPDGVQQLTVYLAYWPAGRAPVSLVASHTPDACWPGSGWQPASPVTDATALPLPARVLPPAEYRLFRNGDYPQHVWFWHLYDGTPLQPVDPRSPLELLRLAMRHGVRSNGDQLFVRVSSNVPWPALVDQPPIAALFERLHAFGL